MILDYLGRPVEKSTSMPNLDPGFWLVSDSRSISDKDVVEKPMLHHVWVSACVRAIAKAVSQVTHVIKNSASQIIEGHEIIDLLEKPNQMMTKIEFFRLIISYLMLNSKNGYGGQCFVIPWNTSKDEKVRLDRGQIPDELIPFNEDFFEPILEKSTKGMRRPTGWRFQVRGSDSTDFDHGEIIRIAMVSPYDVLQGISPYSPVYSAVEMDAKSDTLNINNFGEDGRMDGVFTSDQALLTDELKAAKEEFYQTYTGPQRRRIGFFSGGMKYQQFAKSAADLEYLEQQKWSRAKILGSYGLNRIAVGDYEEINFATIREGRKLLWYDTYIPTDKLILSAFNSQWIVNMPGKIKLASDYSDIPALQSDMKERATTGGILVEKMGFPPALASRIAGVPLTQEDLEEYPYLNEQKTQPAVQESNDSDTKSIQTTVEKTSDNYAKTILDPPAKKFRVQLDKYLYSQRNKIMRNVDEQLPKEKSIDKQDVNVYAWEFLPDLYEETQDFADIHEQGAKIQAAYEKKQIENEFNRGIQWDAAATRVKQWTTARYKYLEDINTKTFEVARDAISKTTELAMEEGVTVTELGMRIKKAVHEVYEVRLGKELIEHGDFDLGGMSSSKTIARTEMGTIASMTRNDIFKSENIEKIRWIAASNARPTHLANKNKVIIFGGKFDNGLKYPRDPAGSAKEVINCRCAFVAVFDDEDE